MPVPVVDLPLGATEDRVVGALDLEKALTAGVKASSTGWLAGSWRCFALHSSYYSAGAARLKAAIALPILQYPASA